MPLWVYFSVLLSLLLWTVILIKATDKTIELTFDGAIAVFITFVAWIFLIGYSIHRFTGII